MKLLMTAVSRRNGKFLYYPTRRGPCTLTVESRRYLSSTPSTPTEPPESPSASASPPSSPTISQRGAAAVDYLPSYLADCRTIVPYSNETPEGGLQLGVAETKLMEDDWLLPMLQEPVAAENSIPSDAIYYQNTAGRDDVRNVFMNYMRNLCDLDDNHDLELNGLILGAGCNAVLENLCTVLADPGDTVLLPTPYYAAFEFDLCARAALSIQPVTFCTNVSLDRPSCYYPTREGLDKAYQETMERTGRPPRILLISHPMNPLGICYPSSVVKMCIDWCRERQVHMVSDEIYAGSVYHDTSFSSALQLAGPSLGPYIHWVYALSKDFGLSGLRVGAVYTENSDIQLPLSKLNDLCQISSTAQLWTSHMLTKRLPDNTLWYKGYQRVNHERLRLRAKVLCELLQEFNVPHLPPTAGLFVWIDLSKYNHGSEDDTYREMVQDFGILLTPGHSMRHAQPGFFRCVFTAVPDDQFQVAMERFRSFLSS